MCYFNGIIFYIKKARVLYDSLVGLKIIKYFIGITYFRVIKRSFAAILFSCRISEIDFRKMLLIRTVHILPLERHVLRKCLFSRWSLSRAKASAVYVYDLRCKLKS